MRKNHFNISLFRYFRTRSLFSLLAGLSLAALPLTSCDVGLGEAVDTYPPTLTLEYPANDGVVIRNTFVMSGVAKDETYIKKVEIFVKSVKDNSTVKAYTADLDSKAKTWSCEVNRRDENGNFDFPDGEYTFETIATDSSGRTTELSRVYKIDNTAPIVVIKKPKLEQPYGRTIKVTGDIADQNEISALYFTAYVNEGTEETPSFRKIGETQEFTSLSKSGLEIIVGRYFDSDKGLTDEEKTLKAVYDAFYDAEKGGTQEAYCLIEVSDEAAEYPGETRSATDKNAGSNRTDYIPGAGTYKTEAAGNLSSCYYLDAQIHKQIYNDRAKNGWQLTNNDLISIFNGTYKDTTDVKKETVKNYLAENCISTKEFNLSASVFSMNPQNNPTFEVAGFDPSDKNIITKNTKFSVVVKQGRDQTELDTDSIRIVLDITENGKLKYTGDQQKANEILLLESYNNIQKLLSSDDENDRAKGELLSEARKATVIADFDTSYQYTLSATGTAADGKSYSTGKSYVVRVEGGDLEDNDILPEDDVFYEFLFKSGSSPLLEITGGTENNAVQAIPDFKTEITAPVFSYSGTLKTDAELSNITIFYTVSVKDEKAEKGTEGKTVVTEKRQLDSSSITTASGDGADNLYNWSIAFDGNSDLFQELQTKASNQQLDLTSGLYLYTFSFYADVGDDNPSQTVTSLVHVDNKKPTATISGITPTVIYSEDEVLPYSDLEPEVTYINGKIQVKGTLDDNYQLEKSVLSAFILDAAGKPSETPIVTSEVGGSMSFTFEINTLADDFKDVADGTKMLIQAVPFDAAGNQGDAAETTVTIDQRTDEPLFTPRNASKTVSRIEDISADKNMFGLMSNNKINADISDDDGIYSWTAYYSTDNGNTWVGYPNTPFDSKYNIESTTASIEINLKKIPNLAEGSYKIRVIVTDVGEKGPNGKVTGSERASDDSFVIAIDEGRPSMETDVKTGDMLPAEKEVTITGSVNDGSGCVKVTRARRKITTDDGGVETPGEVYDEKTIISYGHEGDSTSATTAKVTWSDRFTTLDTSEYIIYTATDKYGLTKDVSIKYLVDGANPTLNISAPEDNAYLGAAYGSSTIAFSGTAADDLSGVKQVEYSTDGTTWTKANGTTQWNANVELGKADSVKTVTVRAVDNAENYSEAQTRKVTVDSLLPVINVTSIEDSVNGQSRTVAKQDGTYYVQSSYTIKGTITEANLDSVKTGGETLTVTETGTPGVYTFSHTVNLDDAADGANTISITALDKAGQQTEMSINIYYDATNPVPSLNISPFVSANGKDNNVNGKISVRGTAIDDDKIAETRLKIEETESGELVYENKTSNPTNFTTDVPLTPFIQDGGHVMFPGTELEKTVQIHDKTAYTVTMTTTDRSGRTGIVTAPVFIDEDTDRPILNLSNTNVDITSPEGISASSSGNLFNQTSNNKMLGTITDDDGIKSSLIEYAAVTKETDGTYTAGPYSELLKETAGSSGTLGTTYSLAAELKKAGTALLEGKYKIRITVEDTSDTSAEHKLVSEFCVGVDNGAPSLTISTQSGYKPESFVVTGTANDTSFKKISCYKTKIQGGVKVKDGDAIATSLASEAEEAGIRLISYNAQTGVWTDSYSGITEGGTVIYVAEDEYSQTTEASWTWNFDNKLPTVAANWTKTDMSGWSANSAQQFKVPVSDRVHHYQNEGIWTDELWNEESVSGIDSVTIAVDGDEPSVMAQGKEYDDLELTSATGNVKPYVWYTSTQILDNGAHTVTVTAADQSGNSAELASFEVNIDMKAPSFTPYTENGTDYVKASDTLLTQAKVAALNTTPFTLKVKPTDANPSARGGKVSGIKEFRLYDGNTLLTQEITSGDGGVYSVSPAPDAESGIYADGTECTFTLKAAAVNTTGTHNFYIEAVDAAGNSKKESVTVFVDVTPPALSFNDPSPYVSVKTGETTVKKHNGIITISGKASDETELGTEDALSYEILDSTGASLSPAVTGKADLSGGKSSDFSFDIDTTALTGADAAGTFKVKVSAEDKVKNTATNQAALITLEIDQTTDRPKISLSNMSIYKDPEASPLVPVTAYDEANKSRNLFGMGSNTIYGTVTDDDGIESIVLKIDGHVINDPESENTTPENTKPYFTVTGKPTSYSLEIDLSKVKIGSGSSATDITAGAHSLSIEVQDSSRFKEDGVTQALSKTTFTVNTDSVNGTYFAYDDEAPKVSVVRCNGKDYTNNMWGKGEFYLYLKATDNSDETGTSLKVKCSEAKMSPDGKAAYTPYVAKDDSGVEIPEAVAFVPAADTTDETIKNTWKCSTVNKEGHYQRTYEVSDKYGRTTTTSISYRVDTTNPKFNSEHIAFFGTSPSIITSGNDAVDAKEGVVISTAQNYWFSSDAVKIIGRGKKDPSTEVVTQALVEDYPDSITISVTGTGATTEYPVNAGTNNAFNSTISFEDGQNTVRIDATDKAGLSATPVETIVLVDTKAPSIETAAASTSEINGAAKAALSTTPFYITVTGATDANENAAGGKVSGIASFKVYRGTDDVTEYATVRSGTGADAEDAAKTTDLSPNGFYADGTYYIHLAAGALETGKHYFYVEAIDRAGNISAKVQTEIVNIDVTSPVMSFDTPTPAVNGKYNGVITVTGTVTDETLLGTDNTGATASAETRSVSWEVKDSSGASLTPAKDAYKGFATLSGGKTSSFRFTVDTKEIQKISGTYRIYISAKDAVGNSVAKAGGTDDTGAGYDYVEIQIDQNTDRPSISFNEIADAANTIRKYTTSITGMITDDDEIAEFYVSSGYTYSDTNGDGVLDDLDNDKRPDGTPLSLEIKEADAEAGTAAVTEENVLAAWETYKTYFNAKTAEQKKAILDWTSNASFTYTPEDSSDGSHDLYFYIKDSGGTVYITKKTLSTESDLSESDVRRPYITLKGGTKQDNSAVTSYKTDSNPPTIEAQGYACGTKTSPTANPANVVTMEEYSDTFPSVFDAGGVNKAVLKIRLFPQDELGIKGVSGAISLGNTKLTDIEFTEEKNAQNIATGYWISEEIFVGRYKDKAEYSEWASDSYNLTLTVTDNSNLSTTVTKTLTIDNTPPQITANSLSPSSAVLQTGDFTISGSTADVGGGDIETLKYLVITNELKDKTDTQLIKTIKQASEQVNGGTDKMFAFTFNGQDNPKFPSTMAEASAYSDFRRKNSNNEDTDYYDIPVYFLMIDTFGNEALDKSYTVYFNPFSDRPNVELYTPEPGKNSSLSGPIRVSGSASDNTGVGSVYIQLDVNKDKKFTEADMKILLDLNYEVYAVSSIVENSDYAPYTTLGSETLLECPVTNDEADTGFWGIKCGGTNSWYKLINQSDELQKIESIKETVGTDDVYPLSVRAAAIDENGTLGSWSENVDFQINPNVPTFGSAQVPTIVNSETGEETEYSTLTSSSYVGGVWNLVTSVEHSSGIISVSYKVNNGTSVTIVSGGNIVSGWEAGGDKAGKVEAITNGFKITLPITEATGEGTYNLTITAAEAGQSKSSMASYSVNYDNNAPTISALVQNDEEWTSTSILKNSNYSLTIGSTVEDGTAGLGKVLFYFYRSDEQKGKRIFDAGMNCKDSSGNYVYTFTKNGKSYPGISVDSLSDYDATTESGETYMTVDGHPLYGYKAVGVTRGETTISDVADNMHVREGSLVLIENSYHRITKKEVADGKMTLTFSGSCDTAKTTVFFPYAMSVDNVNRETVKKFTADDQTITNDDKDGMPESISGMASSRSWTAQLHANWMPDGPITFVMFAFDGADNVSALELKSKLETSGPRLAKLHLGTDLNKNSQFTKNEFETYNFLTVEGTYQDAFALTTKGYKEDIGGEAAESTRDAFKIKDKLAVIPEFTGGNGDIYVVFNNNDTATTLDDEGYVLEPDYKGATTAGTQGEDGTYTANTLNPSSGTVAGLGKYYAFSNAAVGTTSSTVTDYKKMSFTFWDSTDGLEAGKDSQKCFVSVRDFVVWTEDTSAPNVVVDKFFWKGTGNGNNSLYLGSSDNGHIELEEDWKKTSKYAENETAEDTDKNPEFDGDPKVSGKIVIRGSAYDDTFLNNISFTMPNFNNGEANTIATYDTTNGAWVKSTSTLSSTPAYEVLSVTDEYFNQNGHKVIWEVAVDTSTITDTAKTDVKFNAVAVDNATKTSADRAASEAAADDTKHRPSYQMDVVPYIRGIKTGLSSLKKNNSSVYDRTALGHYAVSDIEDIYLYGFNLAGGTLLDSAETPSSADLEETAVTSSMKWYSSSLPFTKVYKTTYDTTNSKLGISKFTSGAVSVKVHGVESLNNLNENDSYGTAYDTEPNVDITGNKDIYANFYNRQPNGDNNNLLTDDAVLDVWGIDSEAAKPNSGPLSQPVMAINPKNKQVGFAFANGPLRFSMGDLTKSYDFWEYGLDFWTSIGFAYDANGNSFGTTAGGDIGGGGKSDCFGLFTSRWATKGFTSGTGGHNNGTGQLRLELIGQAESTNGSSFNGDNIDKQRIKSPSIATTVASSDATETNVYLAYYDAINNEIRFKWGIISDANNTTGRSQNNLLYDYYGPKNSDGTDTNSMDTTTKTLSLTQSKVAGSLPYTLEYVSLIAGQTTGKYTFVPGASGTKYTANTAVMTNETQPQPVNAGQYVSIAAKQGGGVTYERTIQKSVLDENGKATASKVTVSTADDLVVAVWYDAANNQMLYSYNTKPQNIKAPTYKDNNYNTIDSYSQSATGWSTPVAVFGEGNGIGEYCKVALDANGKVHIACYDNSNADVWYAYIDDYTNPEAARTCIVDSYGIVGTELYLDVAIKDGNPVPYISYYGSSCVRPKISYWAGAESIADAVNIYGADEDAFSQLWESSVVPSTSKISLDHINVGVWKDSSGNLTYSTKDGKVPNGKAPGASGSNIGKTNSGTSNGTVYGNGSKNPVLGYAITKGAGGFIETAQMK